MTGLNPYFNDLPKVNCDPYLHLTGNDEVARIKEELMAGKSVSAGGSDFQFSSDIQHAIFGDEVCGIKTDSLLAASIDMREAAESATRAILAEQASQLACEIYAIRHAN